MIWLIILLVIVALVAVGVAGYKQTRSRQLQQRFGPEYDRLVEEGGDRKRAEAELSEMAKRRDALELTDLVPAAQRAYAEEWREVQERFIDDPRQTVADADTLVQQVMRDRGYPVDAFDERIEMVTVDHPDLAENYRTAHAIQERSEQGDASTDDLRDAFQLYRSLFAELLTESDHEEVPEKGER
jgi:hypothetical protein